MALSSTTVPTFTIPSGSSPGKKVIQQTQKIHTKSSLAVPITKCQPFQKIEVTLQARQLCRNAVICAAASSARCAAEQTQTVTRQSSTITIAPVEGKEKSPELDDGGSGFPPRDDGDGGGGGGGGGHHWSGGFFFFGLLAFLGFLKDQESEGPYRDNRRR
ncbi:uncharacterized protein [Typha latifolia]|uniref:uncharacterized protein n=1 Tax=Typha latifolia TaxID=4733 RepID=UPI003C2E6184